MKIYLAADHGGYTIKEKMKPVCADCWVGHNDVELIDCGAHQLNPADDYPDFVAPLALGVQADPTGTDKGIIFCRSGTGVSIAANKFHGIRCGNCFNAHHTRLAIEHNHINVLAIPADYVSEEEITLMIQTFFTAHPDQDERHLRRLAKIAQFEKTECQV